MLRAGEEGAHIEQQAGEHWRRCKGLRPLSAVLSPARPELVDLLNLLVGDQIFTHLRPWRREHMLIQTAQKRRTPAHLSGCRLTAAVCFLG